jgi:MYXO-CTERM domain-containing protein
MTPLPRQTKLAMAGVGAAALLAAWLLRRRSYALGITETNGRPDIQCLSRRFGSAFVKYVRRAISSC